MLRLAPVIALLAGASAGAQELQHLRTVPVPEKFAGHFAYDAGSRRLWLISYGPPANQQGPSKLMELDPVSGRILAEAELPLLGGFGSPVAVDGYLYQPVSYESKIYKIALGDRQHLGRIESVIPIPMVSELISGDRHEPLKFPWLEVNGITTAADGNLLIHASDLGELITLDRSTGRVLKRTPTMKGLGGIASIKTAGGRFVVLANLDPDDAAARDKARRFDVRAPEVVPWKRSKVTLFAHRPDEKVVMWILLDGASGEPVASIEDHPSPAFGSGVVVSGLSPGDGSYGRLTFLAMGPAGILTMAWDPPSGS